MKLNITVKSLKAAIKMLGPEGHKLSADTWRWSDKDPGDFVAVEVDELDIPEMEKLRDLLKGANEGSYRQVSQLLNALADPDNKGVPSLPEFPRMFKTWMAKQKHQWLFSQEAEFHGVAYAVIKCDYEEGTRGGEPVCKITLGYNAKLRYKTHSIYVHGSDMRRSIPKILLDKNLIIGDADLQAEYDKLQERFNTFLTMQGEQFWCRGKAFIKSKDDYWWREDQVSLTPKGRPTKAVLDMENARDDEGAAQRSQVVSSVFANGATRVPFHPMLPLFSLVHHAMMWVNAKNMGIYKYEEDVEERLILPPSHRKLVGALVSNLEVLRMESEAEDKSRLLRSKASSNIILAFGPPGTGKTLTGEVYAEKIKRPLYEVNSGELGISADTIEERLKEVLERAVRLRMPILINEADVFIQARGDSLEQNAIVSVFLRLLEYHNGLVFMTTNRGDTDDAVKNRCIAEIEYGIPGPSERRRLWASLAKEFNVKMTKDDIEWAVKVFPEVVGRDIMMLIRLTSRVAVATETEFTVPLLIENSVFKGIKVDERYAKENA